MREREHNILYGCITINVIINGCCCYCYRGRSGRLRSLPALYQDDDDGNDLSDLGLSAGKKNSVGDDEPPQLHDVAEEREANDPAAAALVLQEEEDVFRSAEQPVAAAVKVATVTTTVESVAENGYDRAIKDYVDFTESKRTSVIKCEEQQLQKPQKPRKPLAEMKRRMSAPKIEEKVMLLRTRSQSTKDLHAAAVGELPKVDIGKRREIFEKICSETKSAAETVQQTTVAVAARQPPSPPPPANKTKPLDLSPPVAAVICAADVRQQVVKEISLPGSPPSPSPGKIL